MLIRSLVVASLIGLSLAFNIAIAEDGVQAASPASAVEGVSFADIGDDASGAWRTRRGGEFSITGQSSYRFPRADLDAAAKTSTNRDISRVEVAFTQNRIGGLPVDVEIAQRASLGINENGDIVRQGQGQEFRLGQRLGAMRPWRGSDWDRPTWYLFAAADDEALTFQSGEVTLQDRVSVGDLQAGITMERGGLQASLAYVEREVSTEIGRESYSTDQRFAGITVTLRH